MSLTAEDLVAAIEDAVGDREALLRLRGQVEGAGLPGDDLDALTGRIDTYLGDLALADGLPVDDEAE